ncbi:MAG: tripartite tricarboxylate transporter permease [archaeon]
MIEELALLFAGTIAGIFTGLAPGIHANTIALVALSFPENRTTGFAIFVVSMAITHSFLDAIPSILFGAPSSDMAESILPGHKMLLKGKAMEAIGHTIFGGIATGTLVIILMPFMYSLITNYSQYFSTAIPAIILFVAIGMIFSEKNRKETIATMALSGILGIVVLSSAMQNPILPLVTGFFAVPSLLEAMAHKNGIPEQAKKLKARARTGAAALGALISAFVSLVPAIGPSQAAFIAKKLKGKLSSREYLTIIGGVNTGNLIASIVAFFTIEKTRTGMAVALKQIVHTDLHTFLVLVAASVASLGIAAIAAQKISEVSIDAVQKINYPKASTAILAFLFLLSLWFSGIWGVVAMLSASCIAIAGIKAGIRRSNFMAFLIVPTLLIYGGFGF